MRGGGLPKKLEVYTGNRDSYYHCGGHRYLYQPLFVKQIRLNQNNSYFVMGLASGGTKTISVTANTLTDVNEEVTYFTLRNDYYLEVFL